MEIREFDKAVHYNLYAEWNHAQGSLPAGMGLLPDQGFIVYQSGKGAVCCAWANLSLGIGTYTVQFLTANPETSIILKAAAVTFLLESIGQIMVEHDYRLAGIYTSHNGLKGLLPQLGWVAADDNLTLFMKRH